MKDDSHILTNLAHKLDVETKRMVEERLQGMAKTNVQMALIVKRVAGVVGPWDPWTGYRLDFEIDAPGKWLLSLYFDRDTARALCQMMDLGREEGK